MENKEEIQELSLDDILTEFQDQPQEGAENVELGEELTNLLEALPSAEEMRSTAEQAAQDAAEAEKALEARLAATEIPTVSTEPTQRLETLDALHPNQNKITETVADDQTQRLVLSEKEATAPAAEEKAVPQESDGFDVDFIAPPPSPFGPGSRLRELKKKLVAGPEKRYYALTEIGVGRLQLAIMLNLLIVLGSAAAAALFALDMIPDNRLRLVIFSQVLGMLVSALLGSHQMTDGIAELGKGRFTINTLVGFTFLVCCVDAVFCFAEQRIPCCAAFSLEMTMALWARYEQRSTEMSQMDTMRKATHLNSLVKTTEYYEGKPGILRGEGQVEDFMDNYAAPSGPHRVQSIYAFAALLICSGIALLAGIRHGVSMAFQIFSTSLLVAVPASFFLSLTRPAAVLERRLHMVGTVLCGWQGVKALCGKLVFPLSDEDLFPRGATKLNGVKFYGDRDPDEAISYSTALMCAAGGNLESVFRQLAESRSCKTCTAEMSRATPPAVSAARWTASLCCWAVRTS